MINKKKEDNSWQEYFERTKNAPPRPLLVEAVAFVNKKDEALDLGSGALNDVRYLLSAGFNHITAVDSTPVAKEIVEKFPVRKMTYVISSFDAFDFSQDTYDLINAQFSLPFNPLKTFDDVFQKTKEALKHGGILCGQFFGVNDEWNTEKSEMTFCSREQVEENLSSLQTLVLREEEVNKRTAAGNMKHWHVFHFICKKPLLHTS